MTTRCVADFLCGKNQSVRFLFSVGVPEASCNSSPKNKVRRSLYLERSFPEIYAGGRGCGRRLAGRATRSKLGGMWIAVFNDFATGKSKKSAECRECRSAVRDDNQR